MKQLLLIILNFSFFTIAFAQSNGETKLSGKEAILDELNKLSEKIKTYKKDVSLGEVKEVGDLYDMNYDLEENLDKISNYIYQMSIEEISDEDEDEEIQLDDSSDLYKGDLKIGDGMKSKVMRSLNDFALVLGWGINSMTHEGDNEIPHELWGSSNWEVGFVNKRQLGNSKSRLVYGLTLNTHYFKLDDTDIINSDVDPGYIAVNDNNFDKVRFGVRYLQVPLGIGIKVGKKAEIYLGGHFGFKVKGYTKKEYNSVFDEDVEADLKADYGLNKFNYGGDISFGVKSLRLFGKYDFNPLFKDGPQHNVYTVGLRYGY